MQFNLILTLKVIECLCISLFEYLWSNIVFSLHSSFLKVQGRFIAIFEETIFALQKEIIAGNNKLKWKVEIRFSFPPSQLLLEA